MRQGYKISLFFACIAVLVLIALILLKRHALYQSEEVPFIEEIHAGAEYRHKDYVRYDMHV